MTRRRLPYQRTSRSLELILTRLQEEAAEARARLDRIKRTGRSPQDPAVVHARKTYEHLQQRLDRIDQVLADVVEKYPTMVDFSEGPGMIAFTSQPDDRSKRQPGDVESSGDVWSPAPVELLRARDRAQWARRMFEKGYLSKAQLDEEIENLREVNARLQANQSKDGYQSQRGGQQQAGQAGSSSQKDPQQGGNTGALQDSANKSPDRFDGGQGQPGNAQQRNKANQPGSSQGQQGNQKQGNNPDQPNSSQGQQGNQPQGNNPGQRAPSSGQSINQQQGTSPDRGAPSSGPSADQQQGKSQKPDGWKADQGQDRGNGSQSDE